MQTTSLSSPSCSSSPSLLGLSSLWPLPGGASRWVDNSSASFSWCRNLLLSECLSCRIAISFVSGCCCHSAVKKWKRMMNMLKTKRIKLKHHWLMTVDINCVTWISESTLVYYRSCKEKQVSFEKALKTPGAYAIQVSGRIFKTFRNSVLRLSRTFEGKGYKLDQRLFDPGRPHSLRAHFFR